MTNLCLTYDYELFFGEVSGTVYRTILTPVNELMKILRANNVKAIFFVDALFLFKLRSVGSQKTDQAYQLIGEQLRLLYSLGYEIELHIHPHWLDAVYHSETDMWNFPHLRRYKLHDLPEEEGISSMTRSQCVALAKQELQRVICEVDINYVPTKFRAGGWCIEPFIEIKKSLYENDILLDYSTIHDFEIKTKAHTVNFSGLPELATWRFTDNIRSIQTAGQFITITTASWYVPIIWYRALKFFDLTIDRFRRKEYSRLRYSDGQAISVEGTKYFAFKKVCLALDTDKLSAKMMLRVEKAFRKRFKLEHNDTIYAIGHPKSMSPASLNELRCYLNGR